MDPVLVVAACALLMLLAERLRPGHDLPRTRLWLPRVVALNAAQVGVVYLAATTWDRWLPQFRLWDAEPLGMVGGTLAGYLAITFVFYWWHRARHEVPLLWRLHQIHHSVARLEILATFYKHPLEILINGVMTSALLYCVVGVSPGVAALCMTVAGLGELFYHWNVRTPYWLGFVFQRPESHRRHHQRGWHRSNYSDLPVWDMLFGTFDNPRRAPPHCGFADDREMQLGRMLLGRLPHREPRWPMELDAKRRYRHQGSHAVPGRTERLDPGQ
ncbi:MAG TPA: sterol desaturase family protein [Xanthomonadaceae bacterium]|nr:sterol desaturase family protein [Xanthomonadaceae bacterium]